MPDDMLGRVQRYHALVLRYEALDQQIDALIMANEGASENMSADELARYRVMARERAEVLNEMQLLARDLLDDDQDT